MRDNSIDDITRRTHRYWYQDGIWEIGFGLVNILLASFYLLVSQFDWTGPMAVVLLFVQMGVIVGGYLLINKVVKYLKERITYPRTGFVAYRRPPMKARLKRILTTVLISGGTAALVGAVASLRMTQFALPLVTGTLMALAMVYLGIRLGLVRLYFLAAALLLLGYGTSRAGLSDTLSTAAFFGGFGLLLLVSGSLALLDYMRRTRPANEALDYEVPDAEADGETNG